jgi:type I restriction enzyme S subunit
MGLPENWTEIPLIELLETLETGSRPKGGVSGIQSGIPSLGGEHLNYNGGFNFDKIKYIPADFAKRMNRGLLKQGDVLVVKDGATTGKTSFVGHDFPFDVAYVNEHVFICRTLIGVEPKCVYYYLRSEEGQDRVLENFTGSAQGGINQKFATNTLIPFPPLLEQRRIVAKLDKLFANLDQLNVRLEKVPELLKQFRQAVLTQAFIGKLTEGWRKESATEDQSSLANKLLRKLSTNYRLLEQFRSTSRFATNQGIDPINIASVPSGWIWATAEELVENDSEIVYGIVQPGPKLTTGVPYVRGMDIENGKILVDQLLRTSKEIAKKYERASLKGGDVLLGIIRNTKVALVPDELFGANITQGTARIRPSKLLDSKFLTFWLNSDLAQAWLHDHYRGIDMPGLNLRDVRKLPIPFCSIEEQKEIVARIETLFAKAEKMEDSYKILKEKIDHLPRAILATAFRGELS